MAMARLVFICLVLTSAAVCVAAEDTNADDMDIDRTHFEDPALMEDPVAKGPHSEIETSWILPESLDGKIPVGRTNDLLVALANSGTSMFNVTHIEGELQDADGKTTLLTFEKMEYGQPLGPREQRSFRLPMALDAEQKQGEYTLVARAYYMKRDKSPFVSGVVNDAVELVPPLPTGDLLKTLQLGLVGVAALAVLSLVGKALFGGSGSAANEKKAAKKAAAAAKGNGGGSAPANEWLKDTLAGTEGKSPKKAKKRA